MDKFDIMTEDLSSEDSEDDEVAAMDVCNWRGTSEAEKNKILNVLLGVPQTNVVFIHGDRTDKDNAIVKRFLTGETWGHEEDLGPTCGLCQKEVYSENEFIIAKGTRYFIYFEKDISFKDFEMGMLQCCFCFEFFHRHGCSLTMSDMSYINKIKSRDWACPLCVPSFVLTIASSIVGMGQWDLNVAFVKNIISYCFEKIHLGCNANIVLYFVCAYAFVFDTGWIKQDNVC
jgi:hypothetical protein